MRSALFPMMCLLLLAGAVRAQSTSASLAGRVSDASKARIVGVRVVATVTETNIRHTCETNAVGEYSMTKLPPGHYDLELRKPGFKALIKSDVILHVQDFLTLDFETQVALDVRNYPSGVRRAPPEHGISDSEHVD